MYSLKSSIVFLHVADDDLSLSEVDMKDGCSLFSTGGEGVVQGMGGNGGDRASLPPPVPFPRQDPLGAGLLEGEERAGA